MLAKSKRKLIKQIKKDKQKVNVNIQKDYLSFEKINKGEIIINKDLKLLFFEIVPFSLSLLTKGQVKEWIKKFEQCLLQFNYPFELYIVDGKDNLKEIYDFWSDRKEKVKNDLIRTICKEQLERTDPETNLTVKKRFYIRMQIPSDYQNECVQCFERVYSKFIEENFSVRIPTKQDLKQLLQYYYNRELDTPTFYDDEFQVFENEVANWQEKEIEILKSNCRSYKDLITPTSIARKSDMITVDNYSIKTIAIKRKAYELKKIPIFDFLNDPNITGMFYFEPILNKENFVKKLDQALMVGGIDASSNKVSEQKESDKEQIANENIIDRIQDENNNVFYITGYLQVHSLNEIGEQKELNTRLKDLYSNLNRKMLGVNQLNLFQTQAYKSTSPLGVNDEQIASFTKINLLSNTASAFYPLNALGLTQKNGYYLGYELTDSIEKAIDDRTINKLINQNGVFYNGNLIDKTTKNKNVFVSGESGSGKTTAVMSLIEEAVARNDNAYILDVEKEYDLLVDQLGGVNIAIGKQSDFSINPLEPIDKSLPFSVHIQDVMKQISFYRPQWSDVHRDIFESYVIQTLNEFGVNDTISFYDIESNDYPIYSDVYTLVKEDFEKYKDTNYVDLKYLNEIKHTLKTMCEGSDSFIFNVKTNIPATMLNGDSQQVIAFDLKTALQANPNKKASAIFNILRFLNMVINNGDRYTAVFFDEMHVFLKKELLSILNEITEFFRRARKRKARGITASQGLAEYVKGNADVALQASSLVACCSQKLIFNQGDVDYEDVNKILKLSDTELDFVKKAQKGQCLFSNNNHKIKLAINMPKNFAEYSLKRDIY